MSFPRYPKYKPSGVEWLGDVPEHWDAVPIEHDGSVFQESSYAASETNPTNKVSLKPLSTRFPLFCAC